MYGGLGSFGAPQQAFTGGLMSPTAIDHLQRQVNLPFRTGYRQWDNFAGEQLRLGRPEDIVRREAGVGAQGQFQLDKQLADRGDGGMFGKIISGILGAATGNPWIAALMGATSGNNGGGPLGALTGALGGAGSVLAPGIIKGAGYGSILPTLNVLGGGKTAFDLYNASRK